MTSKPVTTQPGAGAGVISPRAGVTVDQDGIITLAKEEGDDGQISPLADFCFLIAPPLWFGSFICVKQKTEVRVLGFAISLEVC